MSLSFQLTITVSRGPELDRLKIQYHLTLQASALSNHDVSVRRRVNY